MDPIVQALGDPQTHNAYGFVRNNPMNRVDADGMGFLSWLRKAWKGIQQIMLGIGSIFFVGVPTLIGSEGAGLDGYVEIGAGIYQIAQGVATLVAQGTSAEQSRPQPPIFSGATMGDLAMHMYDDDFPHGPIPTPKSPLDYIWRMISGDFWDLGGGLFGTPYGLIRGVAETIGGAITGNTEVATQGLADIVGALSMPREGSAGGWRWPGTGSDAPHWPESNTKVNLASEWHDWWTGGRGFGSRAQFGWIKRAWGGPGVEPGPYGQAYRILGTVGFGLVGSLQWLVGWN